MMQAGDTEKQWGVPGITLGVGKGARFAVLAGGQAQVIGVFPLFAHIARRLVQEPRVLALGLLGLLGTYYGHQGHYGCF